MRKKENYDLAVIGLGGAGSAVAWRAAKSGLKVLGLEQFEFAHKRGSSHGHTRIIRQAYFEHPNYVPLVQQAYPLWHELEQSTDSRSDESEKLLEISGLLEIGPPDGVVIPGVIKSAKEHNLPIEELSPAECRERFPAFRIDDDQVAVFETESGILRVEMCVETMVNAAIDLGAACFSNQMVHEVIPESDGVTIRTSTGNYRSRQCVLALGSWSSSMDLVKDFVSEHVSVPLQVLAKHLHWFPCQNSMLQLSTQCPTYFYELDNGYFYGFPSLDKRGLKIAEHSGGETVDDPANLNREVDNT